MKYLSNVTTLQVDPARCVGCGMCERVCPHSVLHVEANSVIVEDRDACMECGACARNCPQDAISVQAGVGGACALIRGALLGTEPDCCPDTGECCS